MSSRMSHDLELLMICSHRASCTHLIPFVVQDPDDLNTQGSSEGRVAPNHFLHDSSENVEFTRIVSMSPSYMKDVGRRS